MFLSVIKLLAARESPSDNAAFLDLADFGEHGFELIAHSGEVCIDGLGLHMVGHEDGEKAESVGSGGDGHIVQTTELEVGVGGGRVG